MPSSIFVPNVLIPFSRYIPPCLLLLIFLLLFLFLFLLFSLLLLLSFPLLVPISYRELEERDGTVRTERIYKYSTMWQSHVIDSNSFDDSRLHHNPRSMPVSDTGWIADSTTVGRYKLSKDAISEIYPWHTLRLHAGGEYKNGVRVYGNELYHGDPHQPKVCTV